MTKIIFDVLVDCFIGAILAVVLILTAFLMGEYV